jgi:hypothetical protein
MTTVTALFVLLVLLALGAIALAISVLVKRERTTGRLALAAILTVLAAAVWWIGIRNPPPLP